MSRVQVRASAPGSSIAPPASLHPHLFKLRTNHAEAGIPDSGAEKDNVVLSSGLVRWLLHHRPEGEGLQIQGERRLGRPDGAGAIKGTVPLKASPETWWPFPPPSLPSVVLISGV